MKITLIVILVAVIIGGLYFRTRAPRTSNTVVRNSVQNNNTVTSNRSVSNSSTTNANAANTNSSATAACQSSNLVATLNNRQGTAGTYYYTLRLKNNGTATCTYSGATKVSLLDSQNMVLGSVTSAAAGSFTLATGKSVYAAVGFPNASNYTGSSACTVGVTTLAVYPSGQTNAVTVKNLDTLYPGWTNYYCPGFSVKAFSTTQP